MESDLTVKQIKSYGYDLALFGHIHKPQTLTDKIIVLGSAMAHSFHEVDEKKYFYIFNSEDRTLVKYPTNAPKFLVHDINTEEELTKVDIKDGNYHRINILTPKIGFEDIKDYTNTNVIISFASQSQYRHEGNLEENRGRTPEQEVEDYYEELETELEKDKLKKESVRIINEI
jgi:DNA repair exonuclease SbcCD nuclease subunit